MTPIYLSSTYVQESPGKHKGYEYSRTQNPTRKALEDNLASLESGKFGLCFSSGCAATSSLLMCLNAGDHVVAMDDLYGGTYRLLTQVFSRLGISTTFADLSNPAVLKEHILPNTRLIWIETPTNPMLKLVDIKAICQIAHAAGIPVAVDNTFATPALQQPLKLGADFVVHSMTKYLGGHSDIVGGAIVTQNDDWAKKIAFVSNSVGAILGAVDSFLVLRGLKTLSIRMQKHVENAIGIAHYLEKHPKVAQVIYPGLSSHPHFDLCQKQMSGPGGMISFILKGGLSEAKKFLESTRIFACAESLGGVESLIEHPAIMTHASVPEAIRKELGIADGLIRISVGVEDFGDLKDDLEQAFNLI